MKNCLVITVFILTTFACKVYTDEDVAEVQPAVDNTENAVETLEENELDTPLNNNTPRFGISIGNWFGASNMKKHKKKKPARSSSDYKKSSSSSSHAKHSSGGYHNYHKSSKSYHKKSSSGIYQNKDSKSYQKHSDSSKSYQYEKSSSGKKSSYHKSSNSYDKPSYHYPSKNSHYYDNSNDYYHPHSTVVPPHNALLYDPYFSTCCVDILAEMVKLNSSFANISTSIDTDINAIASNQEMIKNITSVHELLAESIAMNSQSEDFVLTLWQAQVNIISNAITLIAQIAYEFGLNAP